MTGNSQLKSVIHSDVWYQDRATIEGCNRAIDIREVTNFRNFCSRGAARLINQYFTDSSDEKVIWQCDVYHEAAKVAEQYGITRIVDIGCGAGEKVMDSFSDPKYKVTGFDVRENLETCKANYPSHAWHEIFLNSSLSIDKALEKLGDSVEPMIIILSDVIEHLSDPRPILRGIRTLLNRNSANKLILSTPDRDRTYAQGYVGLPENECHVREWNLSELCYLLRCSGFNIVEAGYTRANQYDGEMATAIIVASSSKSFYQWFLNTSLQVGRDLTKVTALVLTTEHGLLPKTGGIGSYVEQLEYVAAKGSVCSLLIGDPAQWGISEATGACEQLGLATTDLFFTRQDLLELPIEDQALLAAEQALFFLPNVRVLECQDYLGLGVRIAQAKRAGYLPNGVAVQVSCHGTLPYIEAANEEWFPTTQNVTATHEKIAIELADVVRFPTKFLAKLYRANGYEFADDVILYERYPYTYATRPEIEYQPIENLVFLGKYSVMKGYPDYVRAVNDVIRSDKAPSVKKIILIGRKIGEFPEEGQILHELRQYVDIEECAVSREEVMTKLSALAPNSIVILPYKGDNHPNTVLEVLDSGCSLAAYATGGIPELVPEAFHTFAVSEPNVESLVHLLEQQLGLLPEERREKIEAMRQAVRTEQLLINQAVQSRYASLPWTDAQYPELSSDLISVIVPVYNTEIKYIKELCIGLNAQLLPPQEVIFVNDCSRPQYGDQLSEFLKSNIRIPYRIITHDKNKGLAGARNTGLWEVKTPYVVNIDSDDIPCPDFLYEIARAFQKNPDFSAMVPYLGYFTDGQEWNVSDARRPAYRSCGQGIIASQVDNQLGHANSAFRVADLKAVGGWDASSKALWEDWQLFMTLLVKGKKILSLPHITILYRVRPKSMARTYNRFAGMLRLVKATCALPLPPFEAYRLQAMARENGQLQAEVAKLNAELYETHCALGTVKCEYNLLHDDYVSLAKQHYRLAHRMTSKFVRGMEKLQFLRRPIATVFGFFAKRPTESIQRELEHRWKRQQ